MIGKVGILTLVLATAAALNGHSPTPTRSGDGFALMYARGLALGHSYAITVALANAASTGAVTIPAAGTMPGISMSSCKSTTVVATWLVPDTFPAELPIAGQLMALTSQDPGAGTASSGMVSAEPGRLVSLPCTVPDGVPVMATAFRS